MYLVIVLICLVGLCNGKIGNRSTCEDYVTSVGYPHENHKITTEDNYILQLDRIPYGLKNNKKQNRPPVLIVHGLGGSSVDFMLTGPKTALCFQLVEQGYDLWSANCRGTFYTNHTTLKRFGETRAKFWDFSWHEIGVYDLPAIIDHILQVTGYEQLTFIGHSQGCTSLFVMLSEKPEYNKKIKAHIGFAPAAFLCHTTGTTAVYGQIEKDLRFTKLLQKIGNFNILPFSPIYLPVCRSNIATYIGCISILKLLLNFSPEALPKGDFSRVFLKYFPAGASTKQAIHYAQCVHTCRFSHYQTSLEEVPKEYNLNNVVIPIYAFSGSKDIIQTFQDTLYLQSKLPNGFKEFHYVEGIAHTDFAIGKFTPKLVYSKALEIINKIHKH